MKQQLLKTWNSVAQRGLNPLRNAPFAAQFFKRVETRKQKRSPAPYLSSASKCVWQMDREA